MQAFGLSCLGRTRHRTLPLPTSVAHTIATGNSFGSGGITTTGIDTTGATLLVIGINGYQAVGNAEGNGITITDTFSNKWYLVANGATAPNPGLAIFYCPSPTVGASHTVNIVMGDGEGAGGYVSFSAWSNTHALVAIGENANSGSSEIAVPFKGGSIAPGLTNDLVLSFIVGYNGFSSTSGLPASIDSSFAILDSEFNATPAATAALGGFSIAYLIAPNTSALNPTWTMQSIVTSAMVSNVVFAQVSTAAVQLVNYINATSGSTLTTSPIDTTGANFIIASVQKYANTGGPN